MAALAMIGGGAPHGGPTVLGPDLWEDMGEPNFVATLNEWGSGLHREVVALRADLVATQAGISGAFEQAQDAIRELVAAFRIEVVAMRQTTANESAQSLARLEHVVEEARARFGEQDARFTSGLGELAQRLQAADAWAQAEPARVAAIVRDTPAPPWLSAPPPAPVTPPFRAAQPAAADSPGRLVMGPALLTSPAWAGHASMSPAPGSWDAYAAGRAAQGPAPHDAWAAAAAAPQQQQQPQHFQMNTPGYTGGGGKGSFPGELNATGSGLGGKGGNPYSREMRLDARGWTSVKLDIGVASDVFQIWKDRAMMFLSRDRPDVRKLLCWAETQTQETLRQNLVAPSRGLQRPRLSERRVCPPRRHQDDPPGHLARPRARMHRARVRALEDTLRGMERLGATAAGGQGEALHDAAHVQERAGAVVEASGVGAPWRRS